ncbi:hypothetical protein M569_00838 [Genlisea aurea]|uniref:Uncharacterized protein n=1 Tax=Genlisea aurea TaxID=192259 RepID=S8D3H6_9LAMI|nr:hypothetical protein M569_00838 [Genlisea aurea]
MVLKSVRVRDSMRRLRVTGSVFQSYFTVPELRKMATNSVSAVQETFFSTKDMIEKNKVVFSVCTSIVSFATAWAGYSLRHYHESRINQKLESIEEIMKNKHQIAAHDISLLPAYVATAGTSVVIGYGLGWRSGARFMNRRDRMEQMRLLKSIKGRRWTLKFLKRSPEKSR